MNLTLFANGQTLDSIALLPAQYNDEYYLKAFRRLLLIRQQQKLQSIKATPFFLVATTTVKPDTP